MSEGLFAPTYRPLDTQEAIGYLRYVAAECLLLAVDTETTGLRHYQDTVVGICLSGAPGVGVYIPIAHQDGPNVDLDAVLPYLKGALLNAPLVMHNASFDCAMLGRLLNVDPWDFTLNDDTMIMARLLGYGGIGSSAGLKQLSHELLGVDRPDFNALFPPKTKKADKRFDRLSVEEAVPYAAADADDTLSLWHVLWPRVRDEGLEDIYKLEMATLWAMLRMEARGLCVDLDVCFWGEQAVQAFTERAEALIIADLEERSGQDLSTLNLGSTQQLGRLLFDDLSLPVRDETATGRPSVGERALVKLSKDVPSLSWLLDMRGAKKLASTYFKPFRDASQIEDDSHILHPNYNQLGTETGRMSSSSPNVQNLPKSQDFTAGEGEDISTATLNARSIIRARPGHYLLEMDWDQVEYRIIAGMSGDAGLLEVFDTGVDLHVNTYALMYDVDPSEVTKAQRQEGKTINYMLNFGAGSGKLADTLGCSRQAASEKIKRYKEAFPQVTAMKKRLETMAEREGYVQTEYGRKRWVKLDPDNERAYYGALREAVNMPVQGTAADLLKMTLVRLNSWMGSSGLHMVATTHDSITFEVIGDEDPTELVSMLRPLCEYPKGFLPGYPAITASFEWGQRWGDLRPVEES